MKSKDIFSPSNSDRATVKESTNSYTEVEAIEVLDRHRELVNYGSYTSKEVQAMIVTDNGNVIEIAPTKRGIVVVEYSNFTTLPYIKSSLSDTLNQVVALIGAKGYTVALNDLTFNDRAIDLKATLAWLQEKKETIAPFMWNGTKWAQVTN